MDWFLYDDGLRHEIVKQKMLFPKILKLVVLRIPLTHFMSLVSFDTPWKYQETFGFLMFSGDIERDQWYEMG